MNGRMKIDVERAKRAAERAKKDKLAARSKIEMDHAEVRLKRALNRISVAKK